MNEDECWVGRPFRRLPTTVGEKFHIRCDLEEARLIKPVRTQCEPAWPGKARQCLRVALGEKLMWNKGLGRERASDP